MTTLVLQTSTPPVQFDIVLFGHVLELRSEYVLNTLLITRRSRFAVFWSHVLEFTCVSSFWPAHRPFSNLGDFAWESLSACVLVTFWLRSEHVLEPDINKCFLVPWPCVNSSWMATTSAAAAVAAAEFLLELCPWPRNVSTVNDPVELVYVLGTHQIAVSWCISGVEFRAYSDSRSEVTFWLRSGAEYFIWSTQSTTF